MKKTLILILIVFSLTACNKLEKQIEGDWAIDQAYINDEPVIWDLFHNGLFLEKDKTCKLPIIDYTYRGSNQEKGTWTVFKENGGRYLQISSENTLFSRVFEVQDLYEVMDERSWGYLLKMTLVSDTLKFDCTKALYK